MKKFHEKNVKKKWNYLNLFSYYFWFLYLCVCVLSLNQSLVEFDHIIKNTKHKYSKFSPARNIKTFPNFLLINIKQKNTPIKLKDNKYSWNGSLALILKFCTFESHFPQKQKNLSHIWISIHFCFLNKEKVYLND